MKEEPSFREVPLISLRQLPTLAKNLGSYCVKLHTVVAQVKHKPLTLGEPVYRSLSRL